MKIIHVHSYYMDGWGYQENLLPKYQGNLGHEVIMVTSDRTRYLMAGRESRLVKTGEYMDGEIRIVRLPTIREFKGRYTVISSLYETLEKEQPDYIFVHEGVTCPSLVTAAKFKQRHPSVFLVADNHADLNNSAGNVLWRIAYYRAYWYAFLRRWMKYVDLIFGVSPSRCYFADEELGVPSNKIRLLPIGADENGANEILAGLESQENRASNEGNNLKIVTGGKWFKGKGLEELIEAIEGLNVRLKIFGKADDSFTEELINRSPDNVTFVGWQDRKGTLQLLKEADLALWPKFHTTLVEDAVATETPLILRYHGSTCHFIRRNGAYLFSGQRNEINQLLDMLSRSRELINDMKAETAKMLDLLSYKRIAKESIEYYENQEPKKTHGFFMNDPLCDPRNEGFYRVK